MEVQWVIFAKHFENKGLQGINITGIYHHITASKFPVETMTILLIAKVKPNINDINEKKLIKVKLENYENNYEYYYGTIYKGHDLSTWVNKVPYIIIPLKVELPYTGQYTFKMFIDGEYKNEESLLVSF